MRWAVRGALRLAVRRACSCALSLACLFSSTCFCSSPSWPEEGRSLCLPFFFSSSLLHHARIHAHMHTHTHAHTRTHTYACTYICVHTHIHTHPCTYQCMHTHTGIHTHTTHTHTRTHTHTPKATVSQIIKQLWDGNVVLFSTLHSEILSSSYLLFQNKNETWAGSISKTIIFELSHQLLLKQVHEQASSQHFIIIIILDTTLPSQQAAQFTGDFFI